MASSSTKDIRKLFAKPSAAIVRTAVRPIGYPVFEPLRHIRLINGDRLTGELLGESSGASDVRLFGQVRLRVPLRFVDRIVNLPGERELLNESFADPAQLRFDDDKRYQPPQFRHGTMIVPATDRPVRLLLPACRGDFHCCFRLRNSHRDLPLRMTWSAEFSEDSRLQTELGPQNFWRSYASGFTGVPTIQRVAWHAGWHTFHLRTVGGRVYLSVDDQLLFAGPAPGELIALEFSAPSSESAAIEIDRLFLMETGQPALDIPLRNESSDAIVGIQGETWWGELQSAGPTGVVWTDGDTVWKQSWRDVGGVVMQAGPDAVSGRSLAGNVVRLELQPSSQRPDLPGDLLTVVLGPNRGEWLEVEHPLLGRLVIPRAAIRQAEHRFLGQWLLCDAREISVRISAHRTADNTAGSIGGRFSLAGIPHGKAVVSIEASGLEPAGPHTPPGSPALKALQAGRFVTELFINDRRVGNFNELTSDWTLPGKFDRLRLPVPADSLKIGQNTWRISRQPGVGSRIQFDDCRIRNVSVEIDAQIP